MSDAERIVSTLATHGERLATLEADMTTLKARSGSLALWVAAAASLLAALGTAWSISRTSSETETLARELAPAIVRAVQAGERR